MDVDFPSKRINIALEYYETSESRQRIKARLEFEGVESFSQIVECSRLEKNAFAGNVNYWIPAETKGTTFIYLTDGCISVNAKHLCLTKLAQ